jgi:S-adenosylmethionine:tRNA-ribosyltransferase-isomerase (queuine synthetase)
VIELSVFVRFFVRASFSIANSMITNFHTRNQLLLMMVAGFGGYDYVKAYEEAVKEKYRFLQLRLC